MIPSDSIKWKFGDVVYHKTDDKPGVVIGYMYRPGSLQYEVQWQGQTVEHHYECELLDSPPVHSSRDRSDV